MQIYNFELGAFQANCYVVADEKAKEAVVVDPGASSEKLVKLIAENKLDIKYILLTHGHFDHILGVDALKKSTGAKVAIHKYDAMCLENKKLSLYTHHFNKDEFVPMMPDVFLNDGDIITCGALKISVKYTPGHTKGGVCYICEDCIFTGDTLFCGSIGRTDFPGGNMEDMLKSLSYLDKLDGDYNIYPGHGESTTLNKERETNIYIREARNAFNN